MIVHDTNECKLFLHKSSNLENISVEEIDSYFGFDKVSYQYFKYKLYNNSKETEYDIEFNKDGIIYFDQFKLNRILTQDEYTRLLSDYAFRLNFMKNLIISIEYGNPKPYKSRCNVIKDSDAFDKSTYKIKYKDKYITIDDQPTHIDHVDMLVLEYNKSDNKIAVFDMISENLYISTITNNIFEADGIPYSINLFTDFEGSIIPIEQLNDYLE